MNKQELLTYLDQGIYAHIFCDPDIDRDYAKRIARMLERTNSEIIAAMTEDELSDAEADHQIAAAAEELCWFARALRFANHTNKNVQRVDGQMSEAAIRFAHKPHRLTVRQLVRNKLREFHTQASSTANETRQSE